MVPTNLYKPKVSGSILISKDLIYLATHSKSESAAGRVKIRDEDERLFEFAGVSESVSPSNSSSRN